MGRAETYPVMGVDLEGFAIRPYLFSARALGARGYVGVGEGIPRCTQLLEMASQDGGFAQNTDFWQLPDIPAGTFHRGHTYLLAITGCTSDAENDLLVAYGACGLGDDGLVFRPNATRGIGNLKLLRFELDTDTAIANDEFGATVLNLSSQQAGALTAALHFSPGPFRPRIVNTPEFIDSGVNSGDGPSRVFTLTDDVLAANGLAFDRDADLRPLLKLRGVSADTAYIAYSPSSDTVGAYAKLNAGDAGLPTSTVQFATTGSVEGPALYTNGKSYTFVLIGIPAPRSAGVDLGLRGLHFIGLPNAPR